MFALRCRGEDSLKTLLSRNSTALSLYTSVLRRHEGIQGLQRQHSLVPSWLEPEATELLDDSSRDASCWRGRLCLIDTLIPPSFLVLIIYCRDSTSASRRYLRWRNHGSQTERVSREVHDVTHESWVMSHESWVMHGVLCMFWFFGQLN
jgi:hypothetical protein